MTTQHCSPWYYTKAILIFILMALFLCFEMALQVSPGVMTVPLRHDLQLTAFGLGLMSGVYFVTYTIMQIPSGLLYDRANFRILVSAAILICAVGAAIFGHAIGLWTGALARMLMGFGSAFAFLSVLTVAARYFPAKYFAMLTGIAQLLAAVGGIAGNLPIAYMVDKLGWRDSMGLLSLGGVVLALIILIFIQKPKAPIAEGDTVEPVWQSLKKIVHKKQTWLAGLYAFFSWAPMTAFASLWGVPFLKTAYGFSTTQAGSLCALIWLGVGLTSPMIGALSDMIGRRNPLLFLTAIIGAIGIAVVVYVPNLPIYLLGIALFFAGIGSSGQILSFAVVKDNAERKRTSTSIGFNNMAVVASGILVQPIVGRLLEAHSRLKTTTHSTYAMADFHTALVILPICFVLCAVLAFGSIKETYCGKKA